MIVLIIQINFFPTNQLALDSTKREIEVLVEKLQLNPSVHELSIDLAKQLWDQNGTFDKLLFCFCFFVPTTNKQAKKIIIKIIQHFVESTYKL